MLIHLSDAKELFVRDKVFMQSTYNKWHRYFIRYFTYKAKGHKHGMKLMKKYCSRIESAFRGAKPDAFGNL